MGDWLRGTSIDDYMTATSWSITLFCYGIIIIKLARFSFCVYTFFLFIFHKKETKKHFVVPGVCNSI